MTDPRENPLVRVIRKGWEQLDAEVDEIVAASADLEVTKNGPEGTVYHQRLEQLKARARGKAEILAYIMNVAYPAAWKGATADDISNEAGRRKKYRVGAERYGTVGVEWNTNVLTASRDELTVLDDKRGVLS